MTKIDFDLAITGGGPAGIMAAIRAAQCGARVILLEKNRMPGAKLLMTGKERCNITNVNHQPRQFADCFGKGGKFLLSALHRFSIEDTITFFHENGLPTKVERGGRVFPESNKALDVQHILLYLLKKNRVTVQTNFTVKDIVVAGSKVQKIIGSDDREISARNFLITTGGLSYPRTGCTGDGYRWAEQMGHTIIRTEASLTPIIVREKWVGELEGLSLKNVRISVLQNNKKQDERFGEALFTGNGLSGPIILDMSKAVGRLLEHGPVTLMIDFKPALDFAKLDKRLLNDIDAHGNKSMKNLMAGLLPKKMIPVMLMVAGIDPEKNANTISKEERKKLRLLLKEFPFSAKALVGFSKAIVTAGGVSLKEIDSKTMRSKLIGNVFFAGEILDLDGPTGGYNLQVCWSTGYVAGESAAVKA